METVLYIITFFIKINYPINENIIENMVSVLPDKLFIEIIIKYNLCVEKIIGILLKNQLWNKTSKITHVWYQDTIMF